MGTLSILRTVSENRTYLRRRFSFTDEKLFTNSSCERFQDSTRYSNGHQVGEEVHIEET